MVEFHSASLKNSEIDSSKTSLSSCNSADDEVIPTSERLKWKSFSSNLNNPSDVEKHHSASFYLFVQSQPGAVAFVVGVLKSKVPDLT